MAISHVYIRGFQRSGRVLVTAVCVSVVWDLLTPQKTKNAPGEIKNGE